MQEALKWLASNNYILLFSVVLGAVLLGKVTIKGYGLGMVASAIVVGAALSAIGSTMGVKMSIDNFTSRSSTTSSCTAWGFASGPRSSTA